MLALPGVFNFSVRAQAKQASEEAEQLGTARAKVGMQMAEKQGRIAALEIECATLKQVRLEIIVSSIRQVRFPRTLLSVFSKTDEWWKCYVS